MSLVTVSTKPLFLEHLLNINVNHPHTSLKILQKNSYRTSRIEMVFENNWFKKQSNDYQAKLVLFMIQNNINLGIIDNTELSRLVAHMIRQDPGSASVPLILRKMSSLTTVLVRLVDDVTRIKTEEDREWFCQLIEHVCDISIEHLVESKLNTRRNNQVAHYSKWYELFDRCEEAPQFLKMSQIHSRMMLKLSTAGTYRARMLKKLHVTMFVEMFYSNLQKENFMKILPKLKIMKLRSC